jgi:hypothetical protein
MIYGENVSVRKNAITIQKILLKILLFSNYNIYNSGHPLIFFFWLFQEGAAECVNGVENLFNSFSGGMRVDPVKA